MACPITDKTQRKYPLKQPDGWKPKVPRWTLRLPEHINELVIAYIGIQNRNGRASIKQENYDGINCSSSESEHELNDSLDIHSEGFDKAVSTIESWTQQGSFKPIIVNRFSILAGRDIPDSREWVCYWTSKSNSEQSLAFLNLETIYQDCNTSSSNDETSIQSIGLWLEILTPDLTRFETNYSGTDYRPGIAELEGSTLEPHDLTGYWGAARDRIRASAYDDFKDDSSYASSDRTNSSETSHEMPSHVKGTNAHTIAHIRSGQFWANCPDVERDAYETSLEPHLLKGLTDIFSRSDELGDYGLRFLRNLSPSDEISSEAVRKETCAAGFSRSLADLENWAKNCPSHHKIYGGAIHHKLKFGQDAKLRTWHEVCILKPGEARWEYFGCDEGTGTIKFQGSKSVKS